MQKSRKLLFFAILIPLVLLIAAPLASTPTLTVPINALADQPGPLTLGDTWIYNLPYNATHNETQRQRVASTIALVEDWNGTMTLCYRITKERLSPPYPVPYNETWSYNYYRVSDQKQIASELYTLLNYSGFYMETYQYIYSDVPVENGYPLSLGEMWNQTITWNMTGYMYQWAGSWSNITWTRSNATGTRYWQSGWVLNISTVTVPAGTFETWCINSTMQFNVTDSYSRFVYFSSDVKNPYGVLETNSTGGWLRELIGYSFGLDLTAIIWWLIWGQLLQQIMSPFAGRNLFILGGAGAALILIAVGIFIWWKRR
nr:hypothetical protein [Candidatus Freyarchaeota archaeon]